MIKTARELLFKELRTGARMPTVGLGCYNIPNSPEGRTALEKAVELGY